MTRQLPAPVPLFAVVALAFGSCRGPAPDLAPPPPGSPAASSALPAIAAPGAPGPRSAAGGRGVGEPPPALASLSLEEAFALAERFHPRLEASLARVDGARVARATAGRGPDPVLVARIENAPVEDVSTLGNADLVLGLALDVPLGDRRDAARRVADADHDASLQRAAQMVLEVRRAVQGAFVVALFARDAQELRSELAAAADAAGDLVRTRIAAGDATDQDLARAELAAAEARRLQRDAELLEEEARARLAASLGAPDLEIASVSGELDVVGDLPGLEGLLAQLEETPTLLAAAAGTRTAAERLALADALRLPDLEVELLYRRLGQNDRHGFDAGIRLPLGLFDGGRGRRDRARSAVAVARADERAARIAGEDEVRRLHLELARALEELAFFEAEILPRHADLAATSEARLAAGDLAPADLLGVRTDLAEARIEALELRRRALVAWADLSPYLRP